jgi:hypothetical protein
MKTSEHLRAVAAELTAIIERNRTPGTNPSARYNIVRICVLLQPASARECVLPLLLAADRYYSHRKHQFAPGAEQLYAEMRSGIALLSAEASLAERNGD